MGGNKPVAIELYKNGEFVHWFPTLAEAARFIGVKDCHLSTSIKRGKKSRGYDVKIGKSIEETIAGFDKSKYEFSQKQN